MPIIRSVDVEFGQGTFGTTKRRVLISPDSGSGAVMLGESIMDPGAALPVHTHLVEEAIVITQGTATATLGDQTHTLSAGDAILAPAGVRHALANRSAAPVRFYFFYPAVEVRSQRV